MPLRGHVDRSDQFVLAGWALADDDAAARPEIKIVQEGNVILKLRPAFAAPALRGALGLQPASTPPTYAWRLWFPLSNGIKPDVPFQILFADDDKPLTLGLDRKIALHGAMDKDASEELKAETLFFPSFERVDNRLKLWFKAAGPAGRPPAKTMQLTGPDRSFALGLTDAPFLFDKPVYAGHAEINLEQVFSESQSWSLAPALANESGSMGFHNSLRRLSIPISVLSAEHRLAPIPGAENIHRVSGLTSDAVQYMVGGHTTFLQLNALTTRYFGKAISEFPVVVDWGVGCARVMRNFFETPASVGVRRNRDQHIIGLDIDQTNIDWCRENMQGLGRYEMLDLDGFRLETASVDLLYGISVLTHLSEFHQHLWLAEVARVLKPGGCAILTTHGEFAIYGDYALTGVVGILTPFVEKFGFFDGIPDNAIGADRDTYYRASYHSRGYLKTNWTRYLSIVDVIPATNAFRQDFVVLRKTAK